MKILFFEPFGGGSHLTFAEQLMARSRHSIDLESLSPRHWRWRQRSSAFPLSRILRRSPGTWDLLFTCDMVDIALLRGITPPSALPPVFLYFHENQWSYPPSDGGDASANLDLHLAFTNLTSLLSADTAAFNSAFHRDEFFRESETFLRRMPDCAPLEELAAVRGNVRVLYPGIADFPAPDTGRRSPDREEAPAPPLILWNHRWEYDKNPRLFLEGLRYCRRRGLSFRLALLGERSGRIPPAMDEVRREFAPQIGWDGHLPPAEYQQVLDRADIVVSTALQENFGLAAAEAVRAGAYPLFPNRLSYPELLPASHRGQALYPVDGHFPRRLADLLRQFLEGRPPDPSPLRAHYTRYTWKQLIPAWDSALEEASAP